MPVSIRKSPFTDHAAPGGKVAPSSDSTPPPEPIGTRLRPAQVSVLNLLMPKDPNSYWTEWRVLNRKRLKKLLGYSPTNSLNRLLNSSNPDNLGMIQLGLIEAVEIDVEGLIEINYRITRKGILCLSPQDGSDPK